MARNAPRFDSQWGRGRPGPSYHNDPEPANKKRRPRWIGRRARAVDNAKLRTIPPIFADSNHFMLFSFESHHPMMYYPDNSNLVTLPRRGGARHKGGAMIYLSDNFRHPGLFGRGEYDLHVREVESWDVRAALRAEPWDSAVRDAQAAAFLRVLLGRDIRITDDAVWLTPDDTLFVATVEFDPADFTARACTWQAITISPFWRD